MLGDTSAGTLTISGTDVTAQLPTGSSNGTLAGQTISWADGPLVSTDWNADWVVYGLFL